MSEEVCLWTPLSLPLSLSISGLYDLVRHYFGPGKGGGVVEHLAPSPHSHPSVDIYRIRQRLGLGLRVGSNAKADNLRFKLITIDLSQDCIWQTWFLKRRLFKKIVSITDFDDSVQKNKSLILVALNSELGTRNFFLRRRVITSSILTRVARVQ